MVSQTGYVIVHVLMLIFLLHAVAGDCMDEGKPCDQCFQTLASHLLNTSDNKYQLQKTFYPPKESHPVFVTVNYHFKTLCSGTSNSCSNANISNCSDTNISSPCSDSSIPNQNKTWFWSSGTFYFFQPLRVFQFTSLFLANPVWRTSDVTLTLPAECVNANEEFMEFLTQRLKLYAKLLDPNPRISSDYHAEAANLDMLESYGYEDNSVVLLYVFQVLFPLLTSILVLFFIGSSYKSLKRYVREHTEGLKCRLTKCRATTWAYFFLCCISCLYIIILDAFAVAYRDYNPLPSEYFHINTLLCHYPVALLVCDLVFTLLAFVFNIAFAYCVYRQVGLNTWYLFMILSGIAPLLCIASHIHYIVIALVTDPVNAGGVGVYIGITIFVQFFIMKKSYVVAPDIRCEYRCISKIPCRLVCMSLVWLLVLGCQAVTTCLLVFMPLSYPVEEEATRLYTFLHGINTLVLALIAYKVIFDQKGSSLSITDVMENVVQKMPGIQCCLYESRTWEDLDEGERLSELLYHFLTHPEAHNNLEAQNWPIETEHPEAHNNLEAQNWPIETEHPEAHNNLEA